MLTKKRWGLVLIAVIAVTFVAPYSTSAQTTTAPGALCQKAETLLSTRSTTIATFNEARKKTYQLILDRSQAIIDAASEKGYDTAKLNTARTSLQTQTATFSTNATNYETSLKTAQSAACGDDRLQFANAVTTARSELTTLRTSSAAIKTTVLTDLVPEIKNYATWLKDNN